MTDNQTTPKEIIRSLNKDLQKQQIVLGLPIGSPAPDFSLPDEENNQIALSSYAGKKVILSFYRGDWCGYCRRELTDLNDHLVEFEKVNAKVLAIAPQTPGEAQKLKQEYDYNFPLLSDIGFSVIRDYRIDFSVHEKIQDIYTNNFMIDIPKLNVTEEWELPVPATFIIDEKGIIQYSFVQMDYTVRLSSLDIIAILRKIQWSKTDE